MIKTVWFEVNPLRHAKYCMEVVRNDRANALSSVFFMVRCRNVTVCPFLLAYGIKRLFASAVEKFAVIDYTLFHIMK